MKQKICLVLFLLTELCAAQAHKAYLIHDFMKGYTLYFVSQTTNSETKEYYKLTENTSKKTVLEYGEKELLKPQINKTAPTIAFKSIADKNIQVLGDVNFDGKQDILIYETMINDDGCYNPQATAHVFVNSATTFVYSKSISDVYNGAHCVRGGSFDIDTKNKRLITSGSGGAALHVSAYYSVSGIEAKEIANFEEEGYSSMPFSKITGKKWENNKWVPFTSLSLYEPEVNKLLSFDTKNGKGHIILFNADNTLYYAFQQNNEYKFVSFAHPSSVEKADKAIFKFRKQNTNYELQFNSGSIKYLIYDTPDSVGIKINVNGKISDWQGINKKGSLSGLETAKLANVTKD